MKLIFTAIALISITFGANSQEIKEWEFTELKSKTANSVEPYLQNDGTILVVIDNFMYHYDTNGELLNEPTELADIQEIEAFKTKKEITNYVGNWSDQTNSDIACGNAYDKLTQKRISYFTVYKILPNQGRVREYYEFDDEFEAYSNTQIESLLYYTESRRCFQQADDKLVGAYACINISNQTHPGLKKPNKGQYHTYLHLVQYDPLTKSAKVTNHLVDKISIPKEKNGETRADILGIMDNKLIVLFSTYRSLGYSEIKVKSKRKLAYWSVDLKTGEEKLLKEYETIFPEEMVNYNITHKILKGHTLITDLSWTEKVKLEDESLAYSSHHKLLIIDSESQFSEERIDVPTNALLLANTEAPQFLYHVNKQNELFYCIPAATQATKKIESSYFLYMFSVDENGEVLSSTKNSVSRFSSPDGVDVLVVKDFTIEELEKMYGNLFVADDYCLLCPKHLENFAWIHNGILVTLTFDYITEHTCGAKCAVEKIMARITTTDLDE